MWPFKQRKTDGTVAYEEHLERLRAWFGLHLSEEERLNPTKTADGHRLDEMVVCVKCACLVLKSRAKVVEYCYNGIGFCGRLLDHYCPTHAPDWDIVADDSRYYRRIPAVPERLEEIVEAPVRVTRKRKSKREAN